MDKHLDEGSERLLGQGWMLGLASDVGEVIPGCGPKPQHRGHGLPVGEAALVLAVLAATCKDIELQWEELKIKNRPLDIASHTDTGCQELLIAGETVLKVQTAPWSHGLAGDDRDRKV